MAATASYTASVCPSGGTGCCGVSTKPQMEQRDPAVSPAAVQVGAVAAPIGSSVCPMAGIVAWGWISFPQTVQCVPSVSPVSVQVGGFPGSTARVCKREMGICRMRSP